MSDDAGLVGVLTPLQSDGDAVVALQRSHAIPARPTWQSEGQARRLDTSVGAIVATVEAIELYGRDPLDDALRHQPPWSDVPFVLLAPRVTAQQPRHDLEAFSPRLTNAVVLERPTSGASLVSAVRWALAARRRQYEIRDNLLALEKLSEEADAANRAKDTFLAMLSHELRNPLAPIFNAATYLASHEPLTQRGQRAVAMIRRQAAQMKHLVDELLEVNRISRGTIELRPEPLVLATVVANVVESMLPRYDAKEQTISVRMPELPVRLRADPVRLTQVLENLLWNALKFTPRGGQVRVDVELRPADVEIRISDTGIGIAPDRLESVFELFVQAQPSRGDFQGGLGIGLTLVRKLVQLHRGTVHAESQGAGHGATFVVRLPTEGGAAG